MEKRSVFLGCFALIFAGLAFSATPSFAQKKTVKTCQEEWRANKGANEAVKITEKDYVAKCRADAAKPAGTTTTAAPAAAPKSAAKKPRRPQAGRICSRASLRRRVEGRKGSRESAVRNDLAAVLERVRQAQEGGWNVSQYVVVKSRTWQGHREVAFLFVRSCRLGQ